MGATLSKLTSTIYNHPFKSITAVVVLYILRYLIPILQDLKYGKKKLKPMSTTLEKILSSTNDSTSNNDDNTHSPPPTIDLATHKNAKVITGTLLLELFRAGFANLQRNHEHCNKINVFPVPDGDTGTNMVISLRSAVKNINTESNTINVNDAMNKFGGIVLISAQGNSGTILSFLFTRLKNELDNYTSNISVEDFSSMLKTIGKKAMGAMDRAQRGTLLSVLEDGCSQQNDDQPKTLVELLKSWYEKSAISLKKTPDQLMVNGVKVLKNFHGKTVVDSGAQGLVFFLQGMLNAVQDSNYDYGDYLCRGTDTFGKASTSMGDDGHDTGDHSCEDCSKLTFRYCTEIVFEFSNHNKMLGNNDKISEKSIKQYLEKLLSNFGDSIVPVVAKMGPGTFISKIHLHTDKPEEVYKRLRLISFNNVLIKEKAEDMREQIYMKHIPKLPNIIEGKKPVGIVALDSHLAPKVWKDSPVFKQHTIPGKLIVKTKNALTEYRTDDVTIDHIEIYNKIRTGTVIRSTTAAPSPLIIKDKIVNTLKTAKEVLVVSPPRNFSRGNYAAVHNAIKSLSEDDRKRVKILRHEFAIGPTTLRAIEMVDKNLVKTGQELYDELDYFHNNDLSICYAVDSLQGLRDWGRLQDMEKGLKLTMLNFLIDLNLSVATGQRMTPPENLEEGSKSDSLGFCRRRNFACLTQNMAKYVKKISKDIEINLIMGHSNRPYLIEKLEKELNDLGVRMNKIYRLCLPFAYGSALASDKLVWVEFWPVKDRNGRTYDLS